jgi:hypothetical protein
VPVMSSWSSTMASSPTMRSAYSVILIMYSIIVLFVSYSGIIINLLWHCFIEPLHIVCFVLYYLFNC